MQPKTTPAIKKSRKRLWIIVPIASLLLVSGLYLLGSFVLGSTSTVTDKNQGIDISKMQNDITSSTASVTSVTISISLDGLTHKLYVRPTFSTSTVSSDELEQILQIAYSGSTGKVETIEIHAADANDTPIDLKPAADDIGIHYLKHIHSISYSTNFLKEAYAN